jgi:hypothetical protein
LTTSKGQQVVGNSTKASRTGGAAQAPMNPEMKEALDNVENPSQFHGKCCEVDAMNKVLNAEGKLGELKGATMGDVVDNKTGATHPACSTCQELKEHFEVDKQK